MTEPARVPPADVDIDTELERLGPRIAAGDLDALVEFFELRGARVTSVVAGDPE